MSGLQVLAALNLGEPGASSVLVGYAVTFGVIGAYTARLVARARRLSQRVPGEDKPWT